MVAFAVMFGFFAVVIGGCEALAGNSDPNQPAAPDYSTDVPAVPSDDFTAPGIAPDDGSGDDGSVNLPGDGYVSGPGIDCGLSGCHGHVLPHFGFHF